MGGIAMATWLGASTAPEPTRPMPSVPQRAAPAVDAQIEALAADVQRMDARMTQFAVGDRGDAQAMRQARNPFQFGVARATAAPDRVRPALPDAVVPPVPPISVPLPVLIGIAEGMPVASDSPASDGAVATEVTAGRTAILRVHDEVILARADDIVDGQWRVLRIDGDQVAVVPADGGTTVSTLRLR